MGRRVDEARLGHRLPEQRLTTARAASDVETLRGASRTGQPSGGPTGPRKIKRSGPTRGPDHRGCLETSQRGAGGVSPDRWRHPPFCRPTASTRARCICPDLGICASQVVELGGIEPPSISRWAGPLRPFPTSGLTLSRRRVGWPGGPRPVFPERHPSLRLPAVFPAAILRFWCRAAVDRPRAAFLLTMSLRSPEDQAARANCSSAILLGCPVLRV